MTVISLLRGVNVGGHKKVPMETLRKVYEALGMRNVTTYVQSGNVVFETDEEDAGVLSARLEGAIEAEFGFHSEVILRTEPEMRQVVLRNPFVTRPDMDPARLLVTFFKQDPGEGAREALRDLPRTDEELFVTELESYVYFPGGMGRSKLFNGFDRRVRTVATSRNWNTVLRLLALAAPADVPRGG